jgi:HK97 family phage prohead protease
MSMPRIKLTDESLNSHGSRVLTDGIDMSLFMKNPVLFYQHDDWRYPLGKWTDIRKDADGSISGVPEFDMEDKEAVDLARKVEQGFLNAASIGLRALELSDDPRHLVKGQTRPTITKSLLLEVSIVNFPANRNAVRMSMEGLPADQLAMVHRMVAVEDKDKPAGDPGKQLIKPEMKEIAKALGLSADATEAECLAALNAQAVKAQATETSLSAARTALKTLAEATVTKLGRADLKERAGKLAEDVNGDALSILLETVPAAAQTSLKAGLSLSGSPAQDDRANWTLTDWRKKDPTGLATMRSEKPEAYEALVASLSKA